MIKKAKVKELIDHLSKIKTEYVDVEVIEKENRIIFHPYKDEEKTDFDFNINELIG